MMDLERPSVSTARYVQQDGSLNHHAIRMVCTRDGRPDYLERSRICRAHAIDCGLDMSPAGTMASLWGAYWFKRWLGEHSGADTILGKIVEAASMMEPPRLTDLEAVKHERQGDNYSNAK